MLQSDVSFRSDSQNSGPTQCLNATLRCRQTDAFLGYARFLAELGGTSLLTYQWLNQWLMKRFRFFCRKPLVSPSYLVGSSNFPLGEKTEFGGYHVAVLTCFNAICNI